MRIIFAGERNFLKKVSLPCTPLFKNFENKGGILFFVWLFQRFLSLGRLFLFWFGFMGLAYLCCSVSRIVRA